MCNVAWRNPFGNQPVNCILGDPARVKQPNDQVQCHAVLLYNNSKFLIPSRCPRLWGARFEVGHDVDHDRLVCAECLYEGWRDLARMLNPDPAHPKASGDGGKVSRPEADQLLSPAR